MANERIVLLKLAIKNVEKIISKVIVIAYDHLLVYKMPKRGRENGEN